MKTNDSNNTIIFLASGLDFHAIDWFQSAKRTSPQKNFIMAGLLYLGLHSKFATALKFKVQYFF